MNIISLNDSIIDVDYVLSQTNINITRSCLKIDKQLLMELESKFLDPKIAKHKTSIEYMSRSNNVKMPTKTYHHQRHIGSCNRDAYRQPLPTKD